MSHDERALSACGAEIRSRAANKGSESGAAHLELGSAQRHKTRVG